MKALYEIAEVEVVKFAIEDIITTSTAGDSSDETTKPQGGMGGPNEGEPGGTFPGFDD